MRNIYLIFRRDFLGYVKAWGFWLSLAVVPIFLIVGAGFGYFAASSSPVRYYTVVEPSNVISGAIEAEFRRTQARAAQDAAELAGHMKVAVNEAQLAEAAPDRKFVEVAPPAQSVEALQPYLTGEKMVSGPSGEKPLFAALILSADGRTLEYWSSDVNVSGLRYSAETAMRDLSRRDALLAAGLNADFLKEADDRAVEVAEFRPRDEAGGGSEVTVADRAPAIVAVALAYFLWLMVFSIIQYLLMGTIEERSNKIFDTLLTSVKLPELLAGKLLAVLSSSAHEWITGDVHGGILGPLHSHMDGLVRQR
jgi:ABC-2 type transport system permease protein